MSETGETNDIRDSFRRFYRTFESALRAIAARTDPDPPLEPEELANLGDQLDEFIRLLNQYTYVFEQAELDTIRLNISTMQSDIRQLHSEAVDRSHHGRPDIIHRVPTGGRGRPSYWIHPGFLLWARAIGKTTAAIADMLHVSWSTVRTNLLQYGIAEPQACPFPSTSTSSESVNAHSSLSSIPIPISPNPIVDLADDDLLDPRAPISSEAPHVPQQSVAELPTGYVGMMSTITDEELDGLVCQLRSHFRRVGITNLEGMLRNMGHRITRDRINQSLARVDPVQRIFQRIRIRRRTYQVAGPNALWHHDGQHGLIRWGIVIHGFIDGYSRLITALRASNNNRGATVLNLFMSAAAIFAIPSRLRGDHGVENILVAAYMEEQNGHHRGSYIWGRSVHNVRIERLWVDVTAQIGATWKDHFYRLEMHHSLDINNTFHIWLLHLIFLPTINAQLAFFAQSWNLHKLQIRDGPNCSPADMYGFDMLVHGIRGTRLPLPTTDMDDKNLTPEELEVYGVDWEGLHDDRLLQSQEENNDGEGFTSWVGRQGPPANLNEVRVDPPDNPLSQEQITALLSSVGLLIGQPDDGSVIQLWTSALALARTMNIQF